MHTARRRLLGVAALLAATLHGCGSTNTDAASCSRCGDLPAWSNRGKATGPCPPGAPPNQAKQASDPLGAEVDRINFRIWPAQDPRSKLWKQQCNAACAKNEGGGDPSGCLDAAAKAYAAATQTSDHKEKMAKYVAFTKTDPVAKDKGYAPAPPGAASVLQVPHAPGASAAPRHFGVDAAVEVLAASGAVHAGPRSGAERAGASGPSPSFSGRNRTDARGHEPADREPRVREALHEARRVDIKADAQQIRQS